MSTSYGTIALSESELVLSDQIVWQPDLRRHDYPLAQRNGSLALALTQSLIACDAIPGPFLEADHNPGGYGQSRMTWFERNGTRGDDILKHPNFLGYLRYFIFGCDLPAHISGRFSEAVDACDIITSGDILPLVKMARDLVRNARLEPRAASDEFFKLALDLGLSARDADIIRTSVRQVKLARYG